MNTAVSTAKIQERQIVEGWGLKSLEMIKKQGLNPTPQNYSVWYEYARGANKKLIEEINQRIQENKPFTLEITNSLYEKFVMGGIDTEAVAEATSRTEKIMEGILKTISSSTTETKNYNKELDSFSTTLTSGGDLQKVVGDILKQTQELKKKGLSILLTDHNVRETLGICDQAYIIRSGTVLASGTSAEVIENEDVRRYYLGENFSM